MLPCLIHLVERLDARRIVVERLSVVLPRLTHVVERLDARRIVVERLSVVLPRLLVIAFLEEYVSLVHQSCIAER